MMNHRKLRNQLFSVSKFLGLMNSCLFCIINKLLLPSPSVETLITQLLAKCFKICCTIIPSKKKYLSANPLQQLLYLIAI